MQKVIALVLLGALNLGLATAVYAEKTEQFFIVTAYYSPLPDQSFYVRGSYEADVRLNGRGVAGASGHSVRPGMLAGPKSLEFGTKIELQGVGIGTILDRGGAIVDAGERGFSYTRLDIYMGAGEEGLCRALNFGVRTLYGAVLTDEDAVGVEDSIDLDKFSQDCSSIGQNLSTPETNIFSSALSPQTPAEVIEQVKEVLDAVGYLKGEVNSAYDRALEESIFDFQVSVGILSNWSEVGAGYFGPKTRQALKEAYTQGKWQGSFVANTSKLSPSASQPKAPVVASSIFDAPVTSASTPELIKQLQQTLDQLGYYQWGVDGVYTAQLTEAIFAFQKSQSIVQSSNEIGAGYLGPRTRAALKQAVTQKQNTQNKIQSLRAELTQLESARSALISSKKQEVEALVASIPQLRANMVDPGIRNLQKILQHVRKMFVKDTAIFGPVTQDALKRYQLELGVIPSLDHPDAGQMTSQTRAAIVEDLVARFDAKSQQFLARTEVLKREIAHLEVR